MHWFKKHIGDYRRRTAGLSLLQHGIYNQLIDEYYLDEGPLPLEMKLIFSKVGARTKEEMEATDTVIKLYFKQEDEGWRHYHCDEVLGPYLANSLNSKENGKKGGRPITHKEPTENPSGYTTNNQEPLTTNQTTRKTKFSEADMNLAEYIWDGVLKLSPNHKPPNLEKWANQIRVTVEQDGRTHKELITVFQWANRDDFWSSNILSPSKLRKQFDKLVLVSKKKTTGSLMPLPDDNQLLDFANKYFLPSAPPNMNNFNFKNLLRDYISDNNLTREKLEVEINLDWAVFPKGKHELEDWAARHGYTERPENVKTVRDYMALLSPQIKRRMIANRK